MNDRLKELFSHNLRAQLERNHKSQRDMCEYMGVSSATGSDWCNGNKMPRVDKIQSLCNWLGCGLSDLLEDSSNDTAPYYLDPEVAELAQALYERPEMRVLFDASRKATKEDIEQVADILARLSTR